MMPTRNDLFISRIMRLATTAKRDDAAEMLKLVNSDWLPRLLDLWKELYPQSYAMLVRRVIKHAAQ